MERTTIEITGGTTEFTSRPHDFCLMMEVEVVMVLLIRKAWPEKGDGTLWRGWPLTCPSCELPYEFAVSTSSTRWLVAIWGNVVLTNLWSAM